MTEPLLEPEQEELLVALVEASRNVPRERREKFLANESHDGSSVLHAGFPGGEAAAYMGDIEVLARAGLLNSSRDRMGTVSFDVSPQGFAYYTRIKQRQGEGAERVQETIRDYLAAASFRQRYPEAFRKWSEAETMLWESDSAGKLTTIGHLCREAMQAFAEVLAGTHQPDKQVGDKAKTIARMRVVLDSLKDQLGSKEKPWLDALLAYWGTVTDLVQRQEHDTQREGGELVWEDGRRVVFQTAVVMFEVDRSVSRCVTSSAR